MRERRPGKTEYGRGASGPHRMARIRTDRSLAVLIALGNPVPRRLGYPTLGWFWISLPQNRQMIAAALIVSAHQGQVRSVGCVAA